MTRRMTRLAAAVLTLLLVAAAPPAFAASSSAPATVGLVSFTGASLTESGATLTVSWSPAARATGYEVFASTSYAGVAALAVPTMSTTAHSATLVGLKPGTDYFVQVRGTSPGHVGARSHRVGHGTIAAEAPEAAAAAAPVYSVLSWNVCSVKCGGLSARQKAFKKRIVALAPGIVALQEASKVKTAPAGYKYAYNGQNDILYRTGAFAHVAKGSKKAHGAAVFASKHAKAGKGVAWAALRDRKTGRHVIVVDVHLVTGTSAAARAQRAYEASRIAPYIRGVVAKLNSGFAGVATWATTPVIVVGDLNTNKSRTGDRTLSVLEGAGWYDAFDQARSLSGQHRNTANPKMSTTPVVGVTWGDHVDKVLVKPGKTVVLSWSNAGAMSGGRYTKPLPSDHHPVLVTLKAVP